MESLTHRRAGVQGPIPRINHGLGLMIWLLPTTWDGLAHWDELTPRINHGLKIVRRLLPRINHRFAVLSR